jgi:hypothetical protein
MLPRHLVLVAERLIVLEAHPFKVGMGVIKSNHHVTEFGRLGVAKKDPTRVSLRFKFPKGGVDRRVFYIPNATQFQDALVAAIQSLDGSRR